METVNNTRWDTMPEVGIEELSNYVIYSVKGNDFLYFACSPDEASNGNPATLLRYKSKEAEDDE